MKPVSVFVDLPNQHLQSADWADRFEIDLPEGRLTPLEAAERALARPPSWIMYLMALRNRLVAFVGLKGGHPERSKQGTVGSFPVLSANEREAVLGLDDKHLDFRILVDVRPNGESGQRVGLTTLVYRKNLLGRVYLAVVTPFHKLIVRALLQRLANP